MSKYMGLDLQLTIWQLADDDNNKGDECNGSSTDKSRPIGRVPLADCGDYRTARVPVLERF